MKKLLILLLTAFAHAAELPPLPAGAFTVVVIPDSQGYLGLGTKIEEQSTAPVTNPWLENHVKFIREHRDDQNIVFVTHVGDIVEKDREPEWAIAKQHLDQLRGVVRPVERDARRGDGHAVALQDLFGLILVNFHVWRC